MPSFKVKIESKKVLGSYATSHTCREVAQSRINPKIRSHTQNGLKKKWLNLTNKTMISNDSWGRPSAKVVENAQWILTRLTEQLLGMILPKVGSKKAADKFMVRVKLAKTTSWDGLPVLTKAVLPAEVLVNPFFISLYLGIITNVVTVLQRKNKQLPAKDASFYELIRFCARKNVWGSPLQGEYKAKLEAFLKTYDIENYHRLFMAQEKTQIYYQRTRGINEWYNSAARKKVEAVHG